ncbi:MAG: glucose-6-phosphate isomerase, partial [Alphaproteobacteria bacterium]|nr:glucose-6-phosphate isomerase [Alphaproteobacteria bacterium]
MADWTAANEAWRALQGLARPRIAELFAADPDRLGSLSARIELGEGGILFDWSKTHLDPTHLEWFEALAEAMDFAGARAALLSGGIVNHSEQRAAEHTAQRGTG